MSDAIDLLARRYAAGEITEAEYLRIRAVLEGRDVPTVAAGLPSADVPRAQDPRPASDLAPPVAVEGEAASHASGEAVVMPGGPSRQDAFRATLPRDSGTFFTRLWRGQVSLAATYWIWGVVVSAVVYFLLGAFVASTAEPGIQAVFVALMVAWAVFIMVIILRSASDYALRHPAKWWGGLAKGAAVLGFLRTLVAAGQLVSGDAYYQAIDDEIRLMKPSMVDENVRLDGATRNGRNLTYRSTLTGKNGTDGALLARSEGVLHTQLRDSLCNSSDVSVRKVLQIMDSITYDYADVAGRHLVSSTIKTSECKVAPPAR